MRKKGILFTLLLVFVLLLSACSSSVKSTENKEPATAQSAGYDIAEDGSGIINNDKIDSDESTEKTSSYRVYTDADSKLIRQASVSIQTIDFTGSVAALEKLTISMGGYYQNAQTQDGDYYDSNARRYAYYTVRIPKDNCDAFLDATGNVGHVVSSNESSTDVGEEYYDTELRLKTLKTKQERLLALMKKANLMEDIIALENALSEVQYEIEQLTSTLKRYDSLVDFATINIEINEVIKISDEIGEGDSLGARLKAAFVNGFSNFGDALSNFVVWIAYHFIGIIIFIVVVIVAFIIIYRWRRNKISKE